MKSGECPTMDFISTFFMSENPLSASFMLCLIAFLSLFSMRESGVPLNFLSIRFSFIEISQLISLSAKRYAACDLRLA